MLLNSNFRYFEHIFKSLDFDSRNSYVLYCLIWTPIIRTFCQFERFFFCPLAKKRSCQFGLSNIYSQKRQEKWRQILDFYINCGKISFSLLTNFASPEKWSMQRTCSPTPLLKFALLPVTLIRQQFSLLARRKYETVKD